MYPLAQAQGSGSSSFGPFVTCPVAQRHTTAHLHGDGTRSGSSSHANGLAHPPTPEGHASTFRGSFHRSGQKPAVMLKKLVREPSSPAAW